MKASSSPARTGFFTLLGLLLAVGTVIYLGATRLWEREERFLIYFHESVHGLSVGSPVKFKGVTIGSVADIRLRYNQKESVEGFYIPVFARIRSTAIEGFAGEGDYINFADRQDIIRHIDAGLRGRLELDSIISGQLYVELDYFAQPDDPYTLVQREFEYPEIPSLPSMMAELGSSAAEVFAQLGAIDVESISEELTRLLRNANQTLEEMDVAAWNESILDTSASVREALDQLKIQPTIDRLNSLLEDFGSVASELERSLPSAIEEYRGLAQELSGAIARTEGLLGNLEGMSAPDAALQRELLRTLRNLGNAARSARELMDYLDRNPSALLRGRGADR